jgi:hypothetical protein
MRSAGTYSPALSTWGTGNESADLGGHRIGVDRGRHRWLLVYYAPALIYGYLRRSADRVPESGTSKIKMALVPLLPHVRGRRGPAARDGKGDRAKAQMVSGPHRLPALRSYITEARCGPGCRRDQRGPFGRGGLRAPATIPARSTQLRRVWTEMKLHACQLQAIERYIMAQNYRYCCIGLAWSAPEAQQIYKHVLLLPRESRVHAHPTNFLNPEFFTEEERLLAVKISVAS